MFQPYRKISFTIRVQRIWLPNILYLACILLALLLILRGAAMLLSLAHHKQWFSFRRIQVVMQAQHLTGDKITRIVKQHLKGGFFSMDVSALRQAILADPWVAEVSFRRLWPDMLEVDVIEQKPVAQWGNARLINTDGQLFSPPLSSFPSDLPVLQGPPHAERQVLATYLAIQNALKPIHLRVYGLSLDPSRTWWMVVDGGLSVKLGQDHLKSRLKKFIAMYPLLVENAENKALNIDLRYPNGAAIEWQTPLLPQKH